MFKRFFNRNLIPAIFVLMGAISLCYGIWGTFENKLWRETWSSFGKTILASGIFASILKLMQISGVFKEELEKLIFEPKFLRNRKDIPNYWDDLSQELFKNRFPGISKRLLADIKGVYLPVKESSYYDDQEHTIEINLDKNEKDLEVKTTISLVIAGAKKNELINYFYSNKLNFRERPDEVDFSFQYLKVNEKHIAEVNLNHKNWIEPDEKCVVNEVNTVLKGSEKYRIERSEIKRYSLEDNDTIYFQAYKLTNCLNIYIKHSANLKITFRKMGTLEEFKLKQNMPDFKRFEYKGIIYPHQGYFFQFKKNSIMNKSNL